MRALDFILNLAGLLLWLNWRFVGFAQREMMMAGVSLVGTLRSTQPRKPVRWPYLAGLGALLLVRSLAYHTIGGNLGISMVLDLGFVNISFNPSFWFRMLIFSILSFGVFMGVFYSWLILVSLIHSRNTEPDACVRLVRQHLGWVGRWPAWVRALVPGLVALVAWAVLEPMLFSMGLFPPAHGIQRWMGHALVFAGFSYLVWWVPVVVLLGLHLLCCYVYLGEAVFWQFVESTGRRLTSRLPAALTRFHKVAVGPLLVLLLVWVGANLVRDLLLWIWRESAKLG